MQGAGILFSVLVTNDSGWGVLYTRYLVRIAQVVGVIPLR